MAEKTNPLTCKQCGYANEGERVYCHNCGNKLDRSLLPATADSEEPLAKKQKRIKKAVTPRRGFFAGGGKTFLITMLLAILVAALYLIARAPDDVPPPANKDVVLDTARNINMELEDKVEATTPQPVTYTQEDINLYFQLAIKSATTGYLGDEVKFDRVFVNLDEDKIRITQVQTVFGYPIYCTVYYRLAVKNGKIEATVKGGNIGRLQIHPNLMKNLAKVFQSLWDAPPIKSDQKSLEHCLSIEVHKGHVDLVTQPPPTQ